MFLVVGMIFISFAIAFYVSTMVQAESRLTATFIDGVVALQLAEAGVDQALYYLKKETATNAQLRSAFENGEASVITFDSVPQFASELAHLVSGEGTGRARVEARFEPLKVQELEDIKDKVRLGHLIIQSQGVYTNPQKGVTKRQVRAVSKVLGANNLIVAPEHGYFSRDPRPQVYHVPSLPLDARDFSVKGGKIYLENGMDVELTEYLMGKEFRPLREVGFMDLGYDSFNFFTMFNGGVNFTHSTEIGYWQNPMHALGVVKRYFKFRPEGVFGPGNAWEPVEEPYRTTFAQGQPVMRKVSSPPTDQSINLFELEQYRKMAGLVIEPATGANPGGNPQDNRYFRDVFFPGPLDFRNTVYRNVLPLYGWGDWRRVPPWLSTNPTRRDDVSNALNIDGVTFVKGDVFLEGWYHGIGTLVVQGNVYVGGKVMGLPPQLTGGPSLLNLVILEDPSRETFGGDIWSKATGRVIYKPHHDQDFDRRHLSVLRELSPYFDGAIYAKNGMVVDKTSFLDQLFNMEIEFNLVTGLFDWNSLPNDVFISGTDPNDILFGRGAESRRKKGFNPSFSMDIVSWQQEEPTL